MLEILDRIYKRSCESWAEIKEEKLRTYSNIENFLTDEIDKILKKDVLVSDYLYNNLENYLSGIQYLSFLRNKQIYIRTEDKFSPVSFGRKSKEREKFRTLSLYKEYREKYELLNIVMRHCDRCEYIRVSFTERKSELNSIRIPSYISDRLFNIWIKIKGDFSRKDGKKEIENKIKNSLNDEDLYLFLDINRLRLEKILYKELPEEKDLLKTSIEDMLKILVVTFQFHLQERKYVNQEIDSLFFPLLYEVKTLPLGTIFMLFSKILRSEEIYFCFQLWRNILLPLQFYEKQVLAGTKRIYNERAQFKPR